MQLAGFGRIEVDRCCPRVQSLSQLPSFNRIFLSKASSDTNIKFSGGGCVFLEILTIPTAVSEHLHKRNPLAKGCAQATSTLQNFPVDDIEQLRRFWQSSSKIFLSFSAVADSESIFTNKGNSVGTLMSYNKLNIDLCIKYNLKQSQLQLSKAGFGNFWRQTNPQKPFCRFLSLNWLWKPAIWLRLVNRERVFSQGTCSTPKSGCLPTKEPITLRESYTYQTENIPPM